MQVLTGGAILLSNAGLALIQARPKDSKIACAEMFMGKRGSWATVTSRTMPEKSVRVLIVGRSAFLHGKIIALEPVAFAALGGAVETDVLQVSVAIEQRVLGIKKINPISHETG